LSYSAWERCERPADWHYLYRDRDGDRDVLVGRIPVCAFHRACPDVGGRLDGAEDPRRWELIEREARGRHAPVHAGGEES
jgi:hypothetical protein